MKPFLSTKAQIWGYDLIIAMTIFITGIISIYFFAINFSADSDSLETIFYQGRLSSQLILSEGSPDNWTSSSFEVPGILSGKKINQTKLENFYYADYDLLKKKLGLSNNFYFTFPGISISEEPIEGIGILPVNQENIARVERFTIYKDKPVKFEILIWN